MPDLVVWPIRPNEREPIRLGYGYLTSVLASDDNTEQRAALRRHPVGSIEYSFLCTDLLETQIAALRLFGGQAGQWAAPLWCWPCPLTANVAVSALTLPCVTSGVPFQDPLGLGKYVLVYRDAATWELLEIDTVSGGSVSLLAGTTLAWVAGRDLVFPVRVARLDARLSPAWQSTQVLEGSVRFTFDAYKENDLFALNLGEGAYFTKLT